MNLIKEVQEKVFSKFADGDFREGRNILKKLVFKINSESSTEEKRMVYYNLAWVSKKLNDIPTAKFYIKNIKNIIEDDKFYCKKEVDNYSKVLQFYTDIYKDNLPIEEIIRVETIVQKACMTTENVMGLYVSKFNVAMAKNDFKNIEWVFKKLHTYYLLNVKTNQEKARYMSMIEEMKSELKQKNIQWEAQVCLALNNNLDRVTSKSDIIVGEVF